VTQTALAAQGFPAPRVLWFDADARVEGHCFFVMPLLPGKPLIAGNSLRDIASGMWTLLRRLPTMTASTQAALHRLDPKPLLDELGGDVVGLERWFRQLDDKINGGATGFADALRWLRGNVPASTTPLAVCHGDLWGGNILAERRHVTGVIDWTVVTVADPLLDVGFTTMSLSLAPIAAPRAVQLAAARAGRVIAGRYLRAYSKAAGRPSIDRGVVRYYEALRTAAELSNVAQYRMAEQRGDTHDLPRPTWDTIGVDMTEYFRARTGVRITLPPAA
ncbi:MAG TPA: phosphotransferase, partial [Acidimicrobiales bacterium]|jgi:aminoglycoside phosphotransferase (APT) family kinase protein|nr:phosphotransferase [Acidimicrobiales bacterium]